MRFDTIKDMIHAACIGGLCAFALTSIVVVFSLIATMTFGISVIPLWAVITVFVLFWIGTSTEYYCVMDLEIKRDAVLTIEDF